MAGGGHCGFQLLERRQQLGFLCGGDLFDLLLQRVQLLDMLRVSLGLSPRHQRNAQRRSPRGFESRFGDNVAAEEDAGQTVIVGRRDRIEFVIVAAGASQRQPQQRPADDIDLIVNDVGHHLFFVGVAGSPFADRQHPRGDDTLDVDLRLVLCRQQIAGKLLDDEPVVRHVAVQRRDNPIAIAPGVGDVGRFADDAVVETVGIAHQIEPMPPPTLAVSGRGEQPVDHAGESSGRIVAQKRGEFFRRRRQAGQIERRPAEQCSFVGRGREAESLRLQRREDEAIDLGAGCGAVVNRRHRSRSHRLKRPEPPLLVGDFERLAATICLR